MDQRMKIEWNGDQIEYKTPKYGSTSFGNRLDPLHLYEWNNDLIECQNRILIEFWDAHIRFQLFWLSQYWSNYLLKCKDKKDYMIILL